MPEFSEVPIERVVKSWENNSRSTIGDLKDLIESVKAVGVKEPILVKNLENDKSEVEVFAGFRRLEASKKAKKETIPVLIYPRDEVTKKLMLVLNLTENVQREDLNPIDEANAFMKLRSEHSLSDEEICAQIGIRKSRFDQRMRLLSMPEQLQEALKNDNISMSAALEISKLPESKHKKYIKLATELKGERLRKMVEKELQKIEAKAEQGESKPEKSDDEKEQSAAYTELSRTNRKTTDIIAKHFQFDEKEVDEIKSVNWRAMELDDLKVVTRLFDTIVDIIPNQLEFNDKAEKEIVAKVENNNGFDLESPIVRQSIIQAIKRRSEELAMEGAPKGKKRPKVTHAIVEQVLGEFFI